MGISYDNVYLDCQEKIQPSGKKRQKFEIMKNVCADNKSKWHVQFEYVYKM